jgi:uncharacterized membrane protein
VKPSTRTGGFVDTAAGRKDAARRLKMTALIAAGTSINLHLTLPGIIALIAGILILIFPTILNYVVAAYLILVGLILIFNFHI